MFQLFNPKWEVNNKKESDVNKFKWQGLLNGITDKVMDPLAIFWVLTNSSYLGKYPLILHNSFPHHFWWRLQDTEKLLGLMPIG